MNRSMNVILTCRCQQFVKFKKLLTSDDLSLFLYKIILHRKYKSVCFLRDDVLV